MIAPSVRTRILPAVERANVWLAQRSLRERRLLAGLAVVGLAAALWYGALQPLLAARQSAQARIDLYAELQGRLVARRAARLHRRPSPFPDRWTRRSSAPQPSRA